MGFLSQIIFIIKIKNGKRKYNSFEIFWVWLKKKIFAKNIF
jgi:hypothetical protein